MYGENCTKIIVYNMKRCPKRREIERQIEKRLRITTQKGRTPKNLGYTIQTSLRTIFISSTYNYSSKPSTIVTSFLNSDQFFLLRSTNLLFGLVGPVLNPVLESKSKLVLTSPIIISFIYIYVCVCVCYLEFNWIYTFCFLHPIIHLSPKF